MQNKFKYRLVEARKKKGLSQEALGKKCSTSGRMIAYYEKGEKKPGLDMLLVMAKSLEVSMDHLTGYEL